MRFEESPDVSPIRTPLLLVSLIIPSSVYPAWANQVLKLTPYMRHCYRLRSYRAAFQSLLSLGVRPRQKVELRSQKQQNGLISRRTLRKRSAIPETIGSSSKASVGRPRNLKSTHNRNADCMEVYSSDFCSQAVSYFHEC